MNEKRKKYYSPWVDYHLAGEYYYLKEYDKAPLYMKEEYEDALAAFQHCLELGEGNHHHLTVIGAGSFQALFYIGSCYEKTGEYTREADAYAKALILCPDHKEAKDRMEILKK